MSTLGGAESLLVRADPLGLLFTFLLVLALEWLLARPPKPSKDDPRHLVELKVQALRKKIRELNSVDTFVEQSKAQRLLQRYEEELARMPPPDTSKIYGVNKWLIQGTIYTVVVAYYWQDSLFSFNVDILWPFSIWLAFPGFARGAIGIIGWLMLSRRISQRLFTLPVFGIPPPPSASASLLSNVLGLQNPSQLQPQLLPRSPSIPETFAQFDSPD